MQKIACYRSAYCRSRKLITSSQGRSSESINGPGVLTKTLLVMRLTIFLLAAAIFQVNAKGVSQTINFQGNNVPLEKVFAAIKKQTGLVFFYDRSVLLGTNPVTVSVKNKPLVDFLNIILVNQPLDFSIDSKTITISRKFSALEVKGISLFEEVPPVTGVVRGPDGNPLAGVNVIVKGTKKGVVTDANGKFSIEAEQGKVLVISNIGYAAKEIKINQENTLIVGLEISTSKLDEVQIVAYGTNSPRFQTGNVTSIKAEDIEKQPVNNPLLALQGRVPGLFITLQSGLPGSGIKVRVQGQNSIMNGNAPLYVVNGVPYPTDIPSGGGNMSPLGYSGEIQNGSQTGTGSALSLINPSDIESIDVLKDADATAIYGSRAANGAILITTKKGKAGKMSLDINMQQGWGKLTRRLKMLNTKQYLEMRHEAYYNDSIFDPLNYSPPNEYSAPDLLVWDTTRYTDWQKVFLGGTAQYTNINVGLSGVIVPCNTW